MNQFGKLNYCQCLLSSLINYMIFDRVKLNSIALEKTVSKKYCFGCISSTS
jgi:hypothetical protein